MGCYVNPLSESKEEFLSQFPRVGIPKWPPPEGTLPVVLIENGFFTAAGVAYSERELGRFTRPDPRPKEWFYVPVEELLKASDLEYYLPTGGPANGREA